MLDSIKPMICVLGLGFVAFRLCNLAFPKEEQIGARSFSLFVILNVTGFLLTKLLPLAYLVFFTVTVISLMILVPLDPVARIATFLFLCPILPSLNFDIQVGIPLLTMTWSRLLSLVLLFPLMIGAFREKSALHYPVDKYIWAFFLLSAVLAFRDTSFTNGLRGVAYLIIGVIAPYFVLSRHLKTLRDVRKVMFALLGSLVFAGLINVFESVRTWHLYDQMIVNITGERFMAIERLGILRATGPFGVPSQSAFAQATGLGLLWALSTYLNRHLVAKGLLAILSVGLLVTFSRGNWIAGVIIGVFYLFTANRRQFFKLSVTLAIVAIPLSYAEFTKDVIQVLPFIGDEGSEEAATVSYRQALFDASIRVASENPLFGSTTFGQHLDLDALRQTSGLLDLVNHYLIILLSLGYVGLILFVGIFLSTFAMLIRALRKSSGRSDEQKSMCRAILFSLSGLLVAITTTSAADRSGLFLWCLVAFAAVSSERLSPRVRVVVAPIEPRTIGWR